MLGYGTSVAEAEAAVKAAVKPAPVRGLRLPRRTCWADAGAHLGLPGTRASPGTASNRSRVARRAVAPRPRLKSEGSDSSYTPSAHPERVRRAGSLRAASAVVRLRWMGPSASGSPGGSVPSRSADDTDVDDDTEDGLTTEDGGVGSDASGNGKSSDLAARAGSIEMRVTRARAAARSAAPAGPS